MFASKSGRFALSLSWSLLLWWLVLVLLLWWCAPRDVCILDLGFWSFDFESGISDFGVLDFWISDFRVWSGTNFELDAV